MDTIEILQSIPGVRVDCYMTLDANLKDYEELGVMMKVSVTKAEYSEISILRSIVDAFRVKFRGRLDFKRPPPPAMQGTITYIVPLWIDGIPAQLWSSYDEKTYRLKIGIVGRFHKTMLVRANERMAAERDAQIRAAGILANYVGTPEFKELVTNLQVGCTIIPRSHDDLCPLQQSPGT